MPSRLILILLTSLLFSPITLAESLSVPGHRSDDQLPEMPRRGTSMETVLAEFGQPDERYGPIGEPPISEWVYGGFRVYFEHQVVLHTINLGTLIFPK